MYSSYTRRALVVVLAALIAVTAAHLRRAMAANFTVNSLADAVDAMPGDGQCAAADSTCTLRAAIQEANALPGADSIGLPSGTYVLSIAGSNEDAAATGDLDITDDLTINGSGAGGTIIDAGSIDRVFDILSGVNVSISLVTIQKGNTSAAGGGIRNAGNLTLTNVTVRNNVAGADGGGVVNIGEGNLQLEGGTISGNSTTTYGGGLANIDSGFAQLTNVTISGTNSANSGGGGIENFPPATMQLQSVTIAGNSANTGGDIYSFTTLQVRDTIISGSLSGGNCTGTDLLSLGHNIDSGSTCIHTGTDGNAAAGDLINTDPLLGPLQNNGGPTLTQALLPGSPAIDAGDASCPATDQRGLPRSGVGNAACDIGAYEVQPGVAGTPSPTATPTPTLSTPTSTRTATIPTPTPSPPASTATPSAGLTSTPTVSPSMTATPPSNDCCQCNGDGPFCGPAVNGSCGECVLIPGARCDGSSGECMTLTPTPTVVPTSTPTPTPSSTETSTATPTLSFTPTATSVPTNTPGPNDCCACTAGVPVVCGPPTDGSCGACAVVFGASCDGLSGQCIAFTATPTATASVTETATHTPSATPTVPATPTATSIPTATETATPSTTPTSTVTATAESTDSPTATATASPTSSETPTETPAPPATDTPTQLATFTPTVVACVGDCDGLGQVTIDELLTMVNIALDNTPVGACTAGDRNHDGSISVDEILAAVNNALNGCTGAASMQGAVLQAK